MQSNTETNDSDKSGTDKIGSTSDLVALPTGKVNVSFSEIRTWSECSYRHKLQHIDKIEIKTPATIMDFGTAVHAAHEHFIRTKTIDASIMLKKLHELWTIGAKLFPDEYTTEAFKQFAKEGKTILSEIPTFYDETFPGWTPIDAEHQLYERIADQPHIFKGFIDAIITAPGKRGKQVVWILDAKTTAWGWNRYKREDDMVKAQLVLYKNYWSKKVNVDPKDVRCGFVLLKRTAKPTQHCELITVSVGDVTSRRSLKVVNNMVTSIKRGIAIKNRDQCTYCVYKGTKHCT